MNKSAIFSSLVGYSVTFLCSCSLFDKPEPVPAFIKVDQFDLTVPSNLGTSSHRIEDCWVFVNDNLAGVYDLPAVVPIHATGTQNIKVLSGIYKNGASAERIYYPFYTYFDQDINLIPDSTHEIRPAITYETNLVNWLEDFEDPGFKLNSTSNSDVSMIVADPTQYNDLFEGSCGLIKMSSSDVYCEMRTNEVLFDDFPRTLEVPAYLELNYKCNYNFVIGLLSKDQGINSFVNTPLITFNPSTNENGVMEWRKTYLYLPDVTNFFPTATDFDLYISVYNTTSEEVEVFVDNLKVFYRP